MFVTPGPSLYSYTYIIAYNEQLLLRIQLINSRRFALALFTFGLPSAYLFPSNLFII